MEGFKKNEEQLKHYVAEYKTKLKNQDQVSECHPQSRTLGFVDLSLILDSKLFSNSYQTFSGTICWKPTQRRSWRKQTRRLTISREARWDWDLGELGIISCFSQDAEIAKLTALLKKTEMKATSLERTVKLFISNFSFFWRSTLLL